MSALKNLLDRESTKLARQKANLEATELELEMGIGKANVVQGKIDRQKEAIVQTEANVKKLEAAVKKLK